MQLISAVDECKRWLRRLFRRLALSKIAESSDPDFLYPFATASGSVPLPSPAPSIVNGGGNAGDPTRRRFCDSTFCWSRGDTGAFRLVILTVGGTRLSCPPNWK